MRAFEILKVMFEKRQNSFVNENCNALKVRKLLMFVSFRTFNFLRKPRIYSFLSYLIICHKIISYYY